MPKVIEANLERGRPAANEALRRMADALATARRGGASAVVLVHGYGSSGVGGLIRASVRRALEEPGMRGIVRDVVYGEHWHYRKRELLAVCSDLSKYEGRVANNEGVTIVIMK